MHYAFELDVPISTTEGNPATKSIKISRGIIYQIDLQFASGVNGSVRARMYLEGIQLYPLTIGYAYRLWGGDISIRDNFPMFPRENTFELRAWAEGARKPHKVQCMVNVMPFSNAIRRVTV